MMRFRDTYSTYTFHFISSVVVSVVAVLKPCFNYSIAYSDQGRNHSQLFVIISLQLHKLKLMHFIFSLTQSFNLDVP